MTVTRQGLFPKGTQTLLPKPYPWPAHLPKDMEAINTEPGPGGFLGATFIFIRMKKTPQEA